MYQSLSELVAATNTYKGSGQNAQLARDVNWFVWERYDPDEEFIYPIRSIKWDDLLEETMDNDSFSDLTKDQTLSILFGLHHRNRIVDGLWESMFARGIMQQLLERLLVLDSDKY